MDGPGEHNFDFNEGVSLVLECENQKEIDYYWEKLTVGGEESMCGWLKDKFGVSWQIIPAILPKLMADPKKAPGVFESFKNMRKLEIDKLKIE
jgi:predicted 3-demethylubiquinone-9 3-methyltransferase (glyoxalase superfamily)